MRKSDAAVYLRAAELMANGEACAADCAWPCCALSKALPLGNDYTWRRLRAAFCDIFYGADWPGHDADGKNQKVASLALLFAAAIAESGDL